MISLLNSRSSNLVKFNHHQSPFLIRQQLFPKFLSTIPSILPRELKDTWAKILVEHATEHESLLSVTPQSHLPLLRSDLNLHAERFLSKIESKNLSPSLKEEFISYVLEPAKFEQATSTSTKTAQVLLSNLSSAASSLRLNPSPSLSSLSQPQTSTSETSTSPSIPFVSEWEDRKPAISRASKRARETRNQLTTFWLADDEAPVMSDAEERTFIKTTSTGSEFISNSTQLISETDVKLELGTEQELLSNDKSKSQKPTHSSVAAIPSEFTSCSRMSNEIYKINVPFVLKPSSEMESLPSDERKLAEFEDQEFLEELALQQAIEEYSKVAEQMFSMGKGSDFHSEQRVVSTWFTPLAKTLRRDFETLQSLTDNNCGSVSALRIISHVEVHKLSVMTLQALLNTLLSAKETILMRTVDVCMNLVGALRAELFCQIIKSQRPQKLSSMQRQGQLNVRQLQSAMTEEELEREEFRPNLLLKAAGHLVQRALEVATVPVVRADGTSSSQTAFRLRIMYTKYPSRIGVIQPHPGLLDLLRRSHISAAGLGLRSLPTVVPPRPWTSVNRGGYFTQPTLVMRTHGHRSQHQVLKPADLSRVYAGLNSLSSVKWKINPNVLDAIQYFWNDQKGFGEIPSMHDLEIPNSANTDEAPQSFARRRSKAILENRNLHSLRMSMKYRIEVAEMFRYRHFYLPHSLDFRGRAYPLPPHLNQMGSDATRGLLLFANKQPLGTRGLFWLKVHLANLYGMDKFDFDGRVAWVDKHMELIADSAEAPVRGRRWWQAADKPFEFLAACHELVSALRSSDPTQYLSDLPVHQDGSCNGLQHYAALGRDEWGGAQVNLVDSEKPQDVYSGVCAVVNKKIDADAAQGDPMAVLLKNKVDRKVVKQTVMTSVYGVTFIGAREQILNRLKEKKDIPWPEPADQSINKAAIYIAKLTFESLGDVFKGAWGIMEWLTQCAQLIAGTGQPVSWITPLGLPVIQPYRAVKTYQVTTALQQITLAEHTDLLPVSKSKQRSAFPPNYVHSLDSTHMFMTALECRLNKGLDFAAVHDSYWSHAGNLDIMNNTLREQFIKMHSGPLLEELRESFVLRYPNIRFPELPQRGSLDLKHVMKSKYFFD